MNDGQPNQDTGKGRLSLPNGAKRVFVLERASVLPTGCNTPCRLPSRTTSLSGSRVKKLKRVRPQVRSVYHFDLFLPTREASWARARILSTKGLLRCFAFLRACTIAMSSQSTAIPAFVVPIIEAYAKEIHPSIIYLMITTVFMSMLVPLLLAMFFFSTANSRRQPMFILVVCCVLLAIAVGIWTDYLQVHESPPRYIRNAHIDKR
jgi:hypothetical protein